MNVSFLLTSSGNPTTVNGQPFATYDNANKIATIAGGAAAHDGDGNLTSISGTNVPTGSFTWDTLSRMTSQTSGGITRDYGYDASGTRIWSQLGAAPKKFYVFDGDLLLGEVDSATGQMTAAYTWGANGLISQRLASGSSWYHFGPQGETRHLTNIIGTVTDSYLYAPYGAPTTVTGTTQNPFRYGGQVGYYSYSDLNLCGARWYNPYLARWLSRDPIGYTGGPNLVEYCGSNPVKFADPEGRQQSSPTTPAGYKTIAQMAVEEAKASGGLLRYTSQWTSYVGQWVKHHVFPRQFRDNFARIFGKDIIDNYTLRVPDWVNKYLHYMTDWNQQWKCFFDYYRRLGRDPSPKEAARFLRWLLDRAGLKDVKFTEFIKYR